MEISHIIAGPVFPDLYIWFYIVVSLCGAIVGITLIYYGLRNQKRGNFSSKKSSIINDFQILFGIIIILPAVMMAFLLIANPPW